MQFTRAVNRIATVALTLSLGFCLAFSEARAGRVDLFSTTLDTTYAWRGIFLQKNALGACAALGLLLCIEAMLSFRMSGLRVLQAALALFLLITAKATAAVVSLALALTYLLIPRRIKARFGGALAIASILILSGSAVLANSGFLSPLLEGLGKDSTLTGRTIIWKVALSASDRPAIGYGLGGYWGDPTLAKEKPSPGDEVIAALPGAQRLSAHNSYFQTYLDLGFVGLALLLLIIHRAGKNAGLIDKGDPLQPSANPHLFMTLIFVLALTVPESHIPKRGIYWIVIVFLYCFDARRLEIKNRMLP
jgi:exopolysaccharide production protein ExoQ